MSIRKNLFINIVILLKLGEGEMDSFREHEFHVWDPSNEYRQSERAGLSFEAPKLTVFTCERR
ncbi:hypothetical protein GCM10007082_02220 [Oceanisphaera arctica]|nr:hypothetical protein GCM10007082_02220 [Oceanisphaera arctica]